LLQSSVFGGEGSDRILVNNNSSASFYSGDLGNDTLLISQTTPIDTPITTTVLGGDGNDTIALASLTTEVTYDVAGGKGADQLNLGGGVDDITFNRGDSVASTTQAFTNNNPALLDNSDTITFANGVDTITNFAGGGGSIADKINVDISTPATLSSLNGTLLNTVLSATNIYEVRGNYIGNVFTVNNVGVGALYIVGGGGLTVDQALRSSTKIFVSTNTLLGAADFT
jgi:microcystin-dependent protein